MAAIGQRQHRTIAAIAIASAHAHLNLNAEDRQLWPIVELELEHTGPIVLWLALMLKADHAADARAYKCASQRLCQRLARRQQAKHHQQAQDSRPEIAQPPRCTPAIHSAHTSALFLNPRSPL